MKLIKRYNRGKIRKLPSRALRYESHTFAIQTPDGKTYITLTKDNHILKEVFITVGNCGSQAWARAIEVSILASIFLRSGGNPKQIVDKLSNITEDRAGFDCHYKVVKSLGDGLAKVIREMLSWGWIKDRFEK